MEIYTDAAKGSVHVKAWNVARQHWDGSRTPVSKFLFRLILWGVFLVTASCSKSAEESKAYQTKPDVTPVDIEASNAYFSSVVPGVIKDGRIYMEAPLSEKRSIAKNEDHDANGEFFKRAVPQIEKWYSDFPVESRKAGFGGDMIPNEYLDLKFIETSTAVKMGQSLKLRTPSGILLVHITGYEIDLDQAAGRFYLFALAESAARLAANPAELFIAAPQVNDCGKSCALSQIRPSDDIAQKIRAVATDKLDVVFPSDVTEQYRTETLTIFAGHFTRKDRVQYVAFFARHAKDDLGDGKWAAYVVDSDLSLISVLARDEYLHVIPNGVADVNGDGLDEIWTDDVGYEGSANSLWYLGKKDAPATFSRVEWAYMGL